MKKHKTRLLLAAIALGGAIAAGPVTKANADSYAAMFAATDFLARKYGVLVYTNHAPMADAYAVTSGNTIIFNSNYISNPDLLRAKVTADVWNGYHPGIHCTPEQLVAAHEFGHVLDNLSGHTTDYELQNAIANGLTGKVSGYSFTSYDEAIAEAFAAVECDVPTSAEQAIYQMLTT